MHNHNRETYLRPLSTSAWLLLLLFCGFFILSTQVAWGAVWYVAADRPSSGGGNRWANAFKTIQEAVDAAGPADEIWVKHGTYFLSTEIKVTQHVGIYGGFKGSETAITQRDLSVNVTTVDGGNSIRGFTIATGLITDPYRCVIDGFSITNGKGGIVISGPTGPPILTVQIKNCTFTNNSGTAGGAIYTYRAFIVITNCSFYDNSSNEGGGGAIYSDISNLTVDNCIFNNNVTVNDNANMGGGAILNYSFTANISNCTFNNNTSDQNGGAILNIYTDGSITNCTFSKNRTQNAGSGGGAICNFSSSPNITNCSFGENLTNWGGGALYNGPSSFGANSSSPVIVNCIFSGNTSDYVGGAIWNSTGATGASPTLTNCTFFNNTCTNGPGGAIINNYQCSPIITNCILWGDHATSANEISNSTSPTCHPVVTYSNVQGGYTGTGNLNADPLFVDSAGGDVHLKTGSPCIDAGNNLAPNLPTTDFEGNPRILDGDGDNIKRVDIGADEFLGSFVTPGILTDKDEISVPWGGSAIVQVKLSSDPLVDVVISVARISGTSTISVQAGNQLTFTSANWGTYQTATLAATSDQNDINGTAVIKLAGPGLITKQVTAVKRGSGMIPIINLLLLQ